MDGGGVDATRRERLGVSGVSNVGGVGSAGLGRENDGHRFLARLGAAGIAASRRRGEMSRRDGAGVGLTTRKGKRVCAAGLSGGYGMGGGSVDKEETMSAAYPGCAGVGSGHCDEESVGVDGALT